MMLTSCSAVAKWELNLEMRAYKDLWKLSHWVVNTQFCSGRHDWVCFVSLRTVQPGLKASSTYL
jgi:hypothetical protein